MADEDSVRIYPMAVLDRHYDESSVSTADTEMDDEVYNRFLDAKEDDKACNGYYDIYNRFVCRITSRKTCSQVMKGWTNCSL